MRKEKGCTKDIKAKKYEGGRKGSEKGKYTPVCLNISARDLRIFFLNF
jgi:hypothetical protein